MKNTIAQSYGYWRNSLIDLSYNSVLILSLNNVMTKLIMVECSKLGSRGAGWLGISDEQMNTLQGCRIQRGKIVVDDQHISWHKNWPKTPSSHICHQDQLILGRVLLIVRWDHVVFTQHIHLYWQNHFFYPILCSNSKQ